MSGSEDDRRTSRHTSHRLSQLEASLSEEQVKFINAVAARVKSHGVKFENVLVDRERDNPKFSFLREKDSPGYHLYRYHLDPRTYRLPSPSQVATVFVDQGKAELYSSDSAEDSEKEMMQRTKKGKLGRLARKRLESGLRGIVGEREQIARLMEFAMGHADAVDEVSECCRVVMAESGSSLRSGLGGRNNLCKSQTGGDTCPEKTSSAVPRF